MATSSNKNIPFDDAKIGKDNTSDDSENCSMDTTFMTTVPSSANNSLLNCVVIKCVFQHLNLHDVKNFRLVCQEWNSVATLILRKKATVVFKRNERGPAGFLKAFKRSNSNLPFTQFRFSEECIAAEAGKFMKKYCVFIKSLKFDCVKFLSPKCEVDSTSYHINSKLWVKCINLNDLHINCTSGTQQIIFIEHLTTVKNVKLQNCFLKLKDGIKISPSNISLISVQFLLDRKLPPQYLINDAFEFYNAKNIYIDQIDSNASILDVGKGVANIERMTLNVTKVINWKTSKWSVNCLILCKRRVKGKTTMMIKELKITDQHYHEHSPSGIKYVDLSVLPFSLEKLSIQNEDKKALFHSDKVDLPNLKTLQIVRPESLTHFANCSNIVSISLKSNFDYHNRPVIRILDLALLPPKLQKLEIEKYCKIVDTRPSCEKPFRIKTLILHEKRGHILRKIQPNVFVLLLEGWEYRFDDILKLVQENTHLKRVLLRSWSIKSRWAIKSGFKKPSFFVFESKKSSEITKLEFDAFLTI